MDNFTSIQSNVTKALLATTRSASELAGEDLAFFRSLDSSVGHKVDRQNARLLAFTERLLGVATANTEAVRPPSLKNLEAVEGNWKAVVDVVDSLLERADTALDEFTGAVRRLSPGAEQATKASKASRPANFMTQLEIEKPQLLFENVPTNRETSPFKPLLVSKPHAARPLEIQPLQSEDDGHDFFPHPYQLEIEQYRYPPIVYTQSDPIAYHPFDSTTATLVDTEETLDEMLAELKQAKEIAVDLEHHDARTYIGIVCLMQISTRNRDWIVDTLKPWRRKLQCLNEVFADPSIIKVLHGAYMDIVWLQRDLGLYVVGLFDTHYAARALGYSGGSLAFLLKKFANVDAQKQYQMADWRVRPLPRELFDYARSDTHYLLYIFDCMRNELVQKSTFDHPEHEGDKIWDILQKSTDTALQRYERPVYEPELGQGPVGWYKLLGRTPVLLTKEQFTVFRAVHQWRDEVARVQDDSVTFIMPNHHIFNIAKTMPETRTDLLRCISGTTQTVRLRSNELLAVIMQAKQNGQNGPDMMEVLELVDPKLARAKRSAATPRSTPQPARDAGESNIEPVAAAVAQSSAALPLRSGASSFWGPAFPALFGGGKRHASTGALAAPLPPHATEGFGTPMESAQMQEPAAAELEPSPHAIEQDDDVFILRDLNKKRKRDAMDSMAAQLDTVALPDEDVDQARDKSEKRKAKKAAKRAAKAVAAAANGTSKPAADAHDDDEYEPFDYAAAPDLLTSQNQNGMSKKERQKQAKQLNPYAKALDAPKGLPPVQKEKAGKSFTYRS